MFTLIISKIFLDGVPLDINYILCNFITNPKVSHFHRTQLLPFGGVVCNTDSGGVVAMDVCFGLWVAQLFKGQMKNHTLFAI
jgi:hypothetical protein